MHSSQILLNDLHERPARTNEERGAGEGETILGWS